MEYSYLPSTDLKVSKICLGTMTFGNQNDVKESEEQMNYALENGVNFFDTASNNDFSLNPVVLICLV